MLTPRRITGIGDIYERFRLPPLRQPEFAIAGNSLYFLADESQVGGELWCVNGSSAAVVKDIRPGPSGSFISDLTVAGNTLYFVADDGSTGGELWKAEAGTASLILDIQPGRPSSFPDNLCALGNTLFFETSVADHPDLKNLWKTEGGAVESVYSDIRFLDPLGNQRNRIVVGQSLFFVGEGPQHLGEGVELWKTDGITTSLVADVTPGIRSSTIRNLTVAGDTLYFLEVNDSLWSELWQTDGVTTKRVPGVVPGFEPWDLTVAGETLYFTARTLATGRELWMTDGAHTALVSDIAPGGFTSYPSQLTAAGQHLYFTANDRLSGKELWVTDGGTPVLLADINPGFQGSNPSDFTVVGETLYFTAYSATTGVELWRTDGTSAGTAIVADLNPGVSSSSVEPVAVVDQTFYFMATDRLNGRMLWKTDGTSAGPIAVADLTPGRDAAFTRSEEDFFVFQNTLYYTMSGRELWALDLAGSLTLLPARSDQSEGLDGITRFSFIVNRSGDTTVSSSAQWAVAGHGANAADRSDFVGGVFPSGTVTFAPGQTSRTIIIQVQGDLREELDESFTITLSNPSGASIATATASGIVRNDDLIGTAAADTLTGSTRPEFLDGLAGRDTLTGGSGPDVFGFRFGQSRIAAPDRISDLRFGVDKLSLLTLADQLRPAPAALSRAADHSAASSLTALASAVFADANGSLAGAQPLAANAAALVRSTNSAIAGTYLLINNADPALSLSSDLMVNLSGHTGTLPALGTSPVTTLFA